MMNNLIRRLVPVKTHNAIWQDAFDYGYQAGHVEGFELGLEVGEHLAHWEANEYDGFRYIDPDDDYGFGSAPEVTWAPLHLAADTTADDADPGEDYVDVIWRDGVPV